ncbi:MAG: carbonic anhydrase family protein [Bryobacteraceae bacterium]
MFIALIALAPLAAADHGPGEEQTPINIEHSKAKRDPAPPVITFNHYDGWNLKVANTYGAQEAGLVIAKEWATLTAAPCSDATLATCASVRTPLVNGPSVTVSGDGPPRTYALQQFHFHAPAEHTVHGKRAAMEIHFVHLYENGCTPPAGDTRPGLVIGALIGEGHPAPALERFFHDIGELPHDRSAVPAKVFVNLRDLLPHGSYTWRYDGGLTAPAGAGLCGAGVLPSVTNQLITGNFPEVVHWFLYDHPLHLSHEQIHRFHELFPEGNSRPLKENRNPVYENHHHRGR